MKSSSFSLDKWFGQLLGAQIRLTLLLLSVGLLSAGQASAEQKTQLGPWDVHYIAMPSTLIDPAIAKAYQLERTKFQGLVNISVLKTADLSAQQVSIEGVAKNLLGQQKELVFREVVEGKAIYYLAQLPYRNEERFTFTLQIKQGDVSQQLQFTHTFYVD
ncbi:hypothetical protein A5320_13035 [Rheinheimera sp. SA_1]|jgi:hypothetical protein|uniref:DUF4426 domain-containing protein n=1 Tax=Rheinheimera sp. SA_1 TaxID=1827365 RepID=UPI0008021B97|nr:DUF4426 domain-containing protein [Rheinheimera sp. SA_1]OBP14658.1 hypothetical protein A5320_13035 [Rheinheimera sp. SA_1]